MAGAVDGANPPAAARAVQAALPLGAQRLAHPMSLAGCWANQCQSRWRSAGGRSEGAALEGRRLARSPQSWHNRAANARACNTQLRPPPSPPLGHPACLPATPGEYSMMMWRTSCCGKQKGLGVEGQGRQGRAGKRRRAAGQHIGVGLGVAPQLCLHPPTSSSSCLLPCSTCGSKPSTSTCSQAQSAVDKGRVHAGRACAMCPEVTMREQVAAAPLSLPSGPVHPNAHNLPS